MLCWLAFGEHEALKRDLKRARILTVQLVACAWLDCLYNWLLRLYRQRKHRQQVIHAARSTGNQLYRQSRTQAHATTCTDSPSTGNQLNTQPKNQ